VSDFHPDMTVEAILEWLNFLATVDTRLEEADVAPGHTQATPFVIRCVAAQVFGKGKSTRSKPNATFLNDPRGELNKYFARCVSMEKKGEGKGKTFSANALKRTGYAGRNKQYKAALAMAREQTDQRRKAAGKNTYGPSKGKKKTSWGKGRKKPSDMAQD